MRKRIICAACERVVAVDPVLTLSMLLQSGTRTYECPTCGPLDYRESVAYRRIPGRRPRLPRAIKRYRERGGITTIRARPIDRP